MGGDKVVDPELVPDIERAIKELRGFRGSLARLGMLMDDIAGYDLADGNEPPIRAISLSEDLAEAIDWLEGAREELAKRKAE